MIQCRFRCPWSLVQGHFWGLCRNINFWRNIHLCLPFPLPFLVPFPVPFALMPFILLFLSPLPSLLSLPPTDVALVSSSDREKSCRFEVLPATCNHFSTFNKKCLAMFPPRVSVLYRYISRKQYIASFGNIAILR